MWKTNGARKQALGILPRLLRKQRLIKNFSFTWIVKTKLFFLIILDIVACKRPHEYSLLPLRGCQAKPTRYSLREDRLPSGNAPYRRV